jgi:hypothetical protein
MGRRALSSNPMSVVVRRLDPHYYDRDGNMHIDLESFEWHEVSLSATNTCEHCESICLGCLESWTCDYEVRLVRYRRELTSDDLRGFDGR